MNLDLRKWNEAAADWDSKIAQEKTYRTALITATLSKLIKPQNRQQALDAGCGNGYYTQWLSENGFEAIGVDGSEEMVKIAKTKYSNLKFEVQDLLRPMTFSDNSYDLILANMLLMHLRDIHTFLIDAHRLLKPSGQLIVSILHPAFNLPAAKLHKSWWQKITGQGPDALIHDYYSHPTEGRFEAHMGRNLTHYHRTIEQYSQEFKTSGFNIIEISEPNQLPAKLLSTNPKLEYAQRLPRFIFFNCSKI